MKFTVAKYMKRCDCRSVGECMHNITAEYQSLDACLRKFTKQMQVKLYRKVMEGYSGWDTIPKEKIIEMIKDHLGKGDMVDVANLAMFLWNCNK